MTRKYHLYYKPFESRYRVFNRLYKGFVKIAKWEFEVLPGRGENDSLVLVGGEAYPVEGETGKDGNSWVRYIKLDREIK